MGLITLVIFVGVILPSLNSLPCERHSLYYVYTALSKPVNVPGIFEFTGMGMLDDRKIDYYNSVEKVKKPQRPWMQEKLPQDYWEKGTQSRKSKEQWFKVNVNILMERKRQNNSDIHVLNWRHGCEVDKNDDGTVKFVRGIDEYSYDGEDFLSFDDSAMQWVAPVPEAVQTKRKWDGVPILNQYTKGYLEKECVEWLTKFMKYADKELEGCSPPEVYLFAKTSDHLSDHLSITCFATGFLPREIDMSIRRSSAVVKAITLINVLPNGDGTHQARLTVDVPRSEANDYECRVNHRTLQQPVVRSWEKDGLIVDATPSAAVIGGILGGLGGLVVLIVVGVIGFICCRRQGRRLLNTITYLCL
ncbi:hypothetical protein ACEWY4_024142 [Coilia grayii]|uniref:Ig-like domain-containing protein n=1 Tax=Coilia grayii TaxID=363190 RepID=A0ABD1J0F6_9TELE